MLLTTLYARGNGELAPEVYESTADAIENELALKAQESVQSSGAAAMANEGGGDQSACGSTHPHVGVAPRLRVGAEMDTRTRRWVLRAQRRCACSRKSDIRLALCFAD